MLGRIIQTLCILLAAILTISEGKPDLPLTVHEIADRSVDLILQINGTGAVKEIYWNFQSFILAHFHNNQLDIKNPKFDNRLEILENGSILRINNLRQEDGGIYHVTVHYTDRNQDFASYILTVYDPVPSPAIKEKCHVNTTDQCNITLHCSVPSNSSDVSYTWKSGHQDSEYKLYGNGSTIQISIPPDQLYTEFLCIVQNLADQKNVSIDAGHICAHCVILKQSKSDDRGHYYILLLIALALVVISGLVLLKLYKKREKEKKMWKVESKEMSELYYADLALGPKSCERRARPTNEEHNKETVYSAVVSQPM